MGSTAQCLDCTDAIEVHIVNGRIPVFDFLHETATNHKINKYKSFKDILSHSL